MILEKNLSPREKVVQERRAALHRKYERAVELYQQTDMALREIAEECHVTSGALGNYLRRYHRELVFQRHHISTTENDLHTVKIITAGKQSEAAHRKYKKAVEACDTADYIEYNVSQIAHKYHLDGTALANFMRVHYEDVPKRREKIRERLGINDHIHRGARKESVAQYAEAVELYRTTTMTLPEVADACRVSESGLSQYLRFYRKDILRQKREERRQAQQVEKKERGGLLGNGKQNNPSAAIEEKYAEALAMYRDTNLTMKEIVSRTGVLKEGFRAYLHKWHRELVLERSGITEDADGQGDLRKNRKRMKTVAAKYADAIESLKNNPRPIARVAAEFGFHPDVFRQYVRKYEPELAARQGRDKRNENT